MQTSVWDFNRNSPVLGVSSENGQQKHPNIISVRTGNNLGPPTPAVEISSIFIVVTISYKTSIYNIRLANGILVAYLLSKL